MLNYRMLLSDLVDAMLAAHASEEEDDWKRAIELAQEISAKLDDEARDTSELDEEQR